MKKPPPPTQRRPPTRPRKLFRFAVGYRPHRPFLRSQTGAHPPRLHRRCGIHAPKPGSRHASYSETRPHRSLTHRPQTRQRRLPQTHFRPRHKSRQDSAQTPSHPRRLLPSGRLLSCARESQRQRPTHRYCRPPHRRRRRRGLCCLRPPQPPRPPPPPPRWFASTVR